MKLNEKCMLVALQVHCWQARKYDKKISTEVSEQHAATSDAGRYNKHLLPGDTKSYDKVKTKAGDIRAFHYQNTLPWSQDGQRILPSANFLTYTEGMRHHIEDYEMLVSMFLMEYPSLKENARVLLNGMYRQEDYPGPVELKSKFGVEKDFTPLPDADDFRVKLADQEIERIRQQIEQRVASEVETAQNDLWQRLRSAVDRMVERLAKPNAVFRDTLVTNLREVVDLIPNLNLTQDEDLEQIRKHVANVLTVHDPQELREDLGLRSLVAKQAEEIASAMQAFMVPV